MRTSLIQRANFNNRDFKKGIDSIVKFDYMGSSEFEWGALPESLDYIRGDIDSYIYLDFSINNKIITVFCKDSHKVEVEEYLEEIASGNMRTQEWHAFDDYINDKGVFKDDYDLWWDIENNLMFWKKNPEFEFKFKEIIKYKPE